MASLQSNCTASFKHHLRQARAKNRHLNLGLQAELYLRTGTYVRPKNTLAIDSACTPLDSALAIDMRPAPFKHLQLLWRFLKF